LLRQIESKPKGKHWVGIGGQAQFLPAGRQVPQLFELAPFYGVLRVASLTHLLKKKIQ